jgi:deoxycytidine triphosphate deaminase
MILSGNEIKRQMDLGRIGITPFRESALNPASYNLRLGNTIRVYDRMPLSTREKATTREIVIPPDGYLLSGGQSYLATTMERTRSPYHAPKLDGRSSTGRLFLFVHVSAGFGDPGFDGEWTLELVPMLDVRVFAGDEICQVAFHEVTGEITPYNGRYQGQTGPTESRMHEGER